ncbi:hypothetical protein TIFTF001_010274 [Ficus carica]|uniref:F-box domain-containing protein n=1 Tax=Ficus carica TaxID=3494 RepID=A0AA87ZRF1_FICCA|nr:hypothetical protein TIFTF001_010274 [Ficus carica]
MSLAERTKTLPNFPNATSQPTPPSRSAETIAHNNDLLTEILLRLPIKSLFKFQSVSKHWLSVISDPNFTVRRNSIPVPVSVSGLFFPRFLRSINDISEFDFVSLDVDDPTFSSCKSPFRSIPFDDVPFANEIVQSCSGLLLCFIYSSRALRPVNRYIVYNPTTKQYTELPPISPIEDDTEEDIYGISLAFDPSHSAHYKVVCVRNSKEDRYQIRFTRRRLAVGGSPVVLSPLNAAISISTVEYIVTVVFIGLTFGKLLRTSMYYGESRVHLHLVDHIFDLQTPRFDVLEMEMDYSGWFVKFRVDLSDIASAFPVIVRREFDDGMKRHKYNFSVLCVVRSEVDEESYLVLQIPGKVIRYNFKNRTFFKLCDYVTDSSLPEIVGPVAHQYFESLALV